MMDPVDLSPEQLKKLQAIVDNEFAYCAPEMIVFYATDCLDEAKLSDVRDLVLSRVTVKQLNTWLQEDKKRAGMS